MNLLPALARADDLAFARMAPTMAKEKSANSGHR
jgi:hypothetical protein